jgi:predicted component of viral defense system (DUF524 family)
MTLGSVTEARIPLIAASGRSVGELVIECLPGQEWWNGSPQLLDLRDDPRRDPVSAPVQLLEDCEYAYRFEVDAQGISVEPFEAFNRSDETGRTGRLRPGRHTGTIFVAVAGTRGVARCELEVRSRKLGYLSEYRWMLQRLAGEATELLMERFAAAGAKAFRPDTAGDPRTLYQRFAFVQALLADASFEGSLQQILRRPHHQYEARVEESHASQGVRADRHLIRALGMPGRRVPLPAGHTVAGLATLPERLTRITHVETRDTVPNRFIRFALRSWRDLAETVAAALADQNSPAAQRGVREAQALGNALDQWFLEPLFAEVGDLEQFPASNQVLQRRDGYRDVYRAFLQAEVAAALDWAGGEEVFAAGQRNVATLYEYWTFLELARVIASIPGFSIDRKDLLKVSKDKLSLDLRRGRAVALCGHGTRRGRQLVLTLWFNRTFPRGARGSWTETMQPDCSLKITPRPAVTDEATTWLHFDAKYRVHSYAEIMGDAKSDDDVGTEESAEPAEPGAPALKPLSQDLLKMHAYRDAIRRTSGAYVLYPGGDEQPPRHTQYHEILPGLGAFVMRPTESGEVDHSSTAAIRGFLEDVLDHVAAGGTSQERADYWTQTSYGEPGHRIRFEQALSKPAADTVVLLGFVKSDEHLAWIQRTHLYNLRADGRRGSVGIDSPELAAQMVVLYRTSWETPILMATSGAFYLRSGSEMRDLEYPEPSGELYLCLALLGEQLSTPIALTTHKVLELTRSGRPRDQWAAPMTVTWSELTG